MQGHCDLAKDVGFTKAAETIEKEYTLAKKMLLAYADFQVVTVEQMEKFKADLKAKTMKKIDKYTTAYKKLAMEPISVYKTMPPQEVLELVGRAKATNLFDTFQVAYITDHVERKDPDPIVFGTITGCPDFFMIAQWGDDVSITDILKSEEKTAAVSDGK